LGDRFTQNQVSVESRLWWNKGWQLHWHHVVAQQRTRLRLGSYSLPLPNARPDLIELRPGWGLARESQRAIAVQNLLGFSEVVRQDSPPESRTHILAWHSLLLLAQTEWLEAEHDLLALTWVGSPSDEALPWRVKSSENGRLHLEHPELGDWRIEQSELPMIIPDVRAKSK
jgi:hypothetical protein